MLTRSLRQNDNHARMTTPEENRARARTSAFAHRLLNEWRRLDAPAEGACVIVAVSGGADSTALLLALDELIKTERLSVELIVAHLDHGLRGRAGQADAAWVAELARNLGYGIRQGAVALGQQPAAVAGNLEQAARRARYEFLSATAQACEASAVLTAHTMDDQAETVLLRLLRGSGADGLCGIRPVRTLEAGSRVLLIRPLLSWANRLRTEEYCSERRIEFRVDEMNDNETFARVRVRKQLLPLLQRTLNTRAVEALSRTADLLCEDAAALNAAAALLLDEATVHTPDNEQPPPLRVSILAPALPALRRRALRQWIAEARGDLRRLEMVHLRAVESLLDGERGGRIIELPGGVTVSRKRWLLRIHLPPALG